MKTSLVKTSLVKTEASRSIKWLYCLTLIAIIIPSGLFGAAGWVGLATGGGLFGGGIIALVVLLGIFIYRIVVVVRNPHTLDAYVPSTRLKIMRYLSIFLMIVGLLGSMAIFFVKPLALGIFGKPGDSGVAFFAMGMIIYLLSSSGLLGLLLFETSRLFGQAACLALRQSSRTNDVLNCRNGILTKYPGTLAWRA